MTKQGSFKRAVRQRARATGSAVHRGARRVGAGRRRRRSLTHVPSRSRTHDPPSSTATGSGSPRSCRSMTTREFRPRGSWPGHYPWTLIVRRADGPPWVARVFSSPADGRAASRTMQTSCGSSPYKTSRPNGSLVTIPCRRSTARGVIVTEFVEGGRPTDADGRALSPAVQHELASLLGRLHTLPAAGGAIARDGGSEEHDGGFFVGRPKQDLAAAMSFLVSVEDSVAPEGRELFECLRDHVEDADDAEGLPEAFTHSNYHTWAAVGAPGNLAIVGWAGSGRGPRLPALAWLLRTAAEVGPDYVDAVTHGYREHVQLTGDELEQTAPRTEPAAAVAGVPRVPRVCAQRESADHGPGPYGIWVLSSAPGRTSGGTSDSVMARMITDPEQEQDGSTGDDPAAKNVADTGSR